MNQRENKQIVIHEFSLSSNWTMWTFSIRNNMSQCNNFVELNVWNEK